MDIYKIQTDKISIKYGKFKNKVNEKHTSAYGKTSANNILTVATKTIKELFEQKMDTKTTNNSLIVGKVQSGKTSNLEMLTALAFDNNINLIVIFGGYDNSLVSQCVERFEATFDIDNSDDDSPYLFSTQTSDLDFLNSDFIEEANEDNRPIILVSLKRPLALKKLNDKLMKINKNLLSAIIIDDEGDQASLDTNKNKEEASATYNEIKLMKEYLGDPIYLSVTALVNKK